MKKNIILLVISLITIHCSSDKDEAPSYSGKYFLIKNIAKINGEIDEDYTNIHEGSCSGQSSYEVKPDNKVVNEVWAAQSGKCKLVGTYNYNYDPVNKKIEGQDVKFEGNEMTIKNVSIGLSTIEIIYYYKKK